MSEPASTIVPPAPTINQGSDISQLSQEATDKTVFDIFDRVMPEVKPKATPREDSKPIPPVREPVKAAQQAPPEPVQEPRQQVDRTPQPEKQEPQKPSEESHLPSSIEQFLDGKVEKLSEPVAEDFPEELPAGQNGEEVKSNWKRLREAYKAANEKLKSQPAVDPKLVTRLTTLEADNKKMAEILAKTSIEHDPAFQAQVMNPLRSAWNDAVRVVKEAGADPAELQRVLALQGKAQYEALDQLFDGMPESAKLEATNALRQYKHFVGVRAQALANAGQTTEQLRRQEAERTINYNKQIREQMDENYTNAVNLLRDKGKVFLLMKSDSPDAQKWNEEVDKIVNGGREFYLNNTDMDKAAIAMVMSRMVDPLMKILMAERSTRIKAEKLIQERLGSEPSLTESGGNFRGSGDPPDLKEPFYKTFIRELRKREATNGVR